MMKTQKRFTPDLLDRYRHLERGIGSGEDYLPWHRVGRSDPASSGRSHLQFWRGRQRELLSDLEWVTFLFATMLNGVVDIREQFPLQLEDFEHELETLTGITSGITYPGTLNIAKDQQVKHPRISGAGRSVQWVMTTDLLLTLKESNGDLKLLAISVKPPRTADRKRTQQLLEIEQTYWGRRDVQWLLVTPDLYDALVAETLRICVPWALGILAEQSHIAFVVDSVDRLRGRSLTAALEYLTTQFGSNNAAQLALWQAIWCGQFPIDLRRGWRPHEPLVLMDATDFWLLNPVASGRSLWPR